MPKAGREWAFGPERSVCEGFDLREGEFPVDAQVFVDDEGLLLIWQD
jgi:hypothetical protein